MTLRKKPLGARPLVQHALRPLIFALHGALLTLAHLPLAQAADAPMPDPETLELTQHSSSVELGAGTVGSSSYKFGEYNGLQNQGGYGIANLDLNGGAPYDSDDTTRWSLQAHDLGLDSREIQLDYGQQGSYRIRLDYDELRRNRSDSYQTPYLGAGSKTLTLPSNWVVPVVPRVSATAANARGLAADVAQSPALVAGVPTAPSNAQRATSAALQAADLPAFHAVKLDTPRQRSSVELLTQMDARWSLLASFRHEDKTGLKPMGSATRQTGSDIAAIIPDVIDQSTEQMDVALHFKGTNSFLRLGYYGSFFTNHVDRMSWQNWATLATPNMNTMSSAPSNAFHQLSGTGGYDLSKTTHLVVDLALGRSTQDDRFLTDATTPVVPLSSAQAVVESRSLSLKLTGRPTERLQLAAGYKFDVRENHTPVNTYQFSDNNQPVAPLNSFNGAVVAQNANANLPYSKRLNRLDLDADYRLGAGQSLKAGVEYQTTDRWCEGSWISCVEAATTNENTLRLEYRNSSWDNVSARVGVEHGSRTISNYNENAFLALVPFANATPTGAPAGTTAYGTMVANGLNGWGPNSGFNPAAPAGSALAFFFPGNNALSNALYGNENRISELPGMRQYNMADREQDKLKLSANWQVQEQWNLQGGVKLHKDDYLHSRYGLQEASGWTLNLDANYQPSDDLSLNAFYTFEDQHTKSAGNTYTANSNAASVNGSTIVSGGCYATIASRNLNNKTDPCNNWSADLHDQIDTLGLAFRYKGMMGGKLQLTGDISVTRAVTDTAFGGGNYVNNPLAVTGAPAGTVAAFYIPAVPLPTVTTKTFDLHLVADYALDKMSTVRVGYLYSYLFSQDWAFDAMQAGGLTQMVPSYEQSAQYSVHAAAVTYVYRFR
jgi:MtrB/PioB family decaheme-associated outer membrane protein